VENSVRRRRLLRGAWRQTLLASAALFLAELPESEDKYARIMKRPQILAVIALLGFAMAPRHALGDETSCTH